MDVITAQEDGTAGSDLVKPCNNSPPEIHAVSIVGVSESTQATESRPSTRSLVKTPPRRGKRQCVCSSVSAGAPFPWVLRSGGIVCSFPNDLRSNRGRYPHLRPTAIAIAEDLLENDSRPDDDAPAIGRPVSTIAATYCLGGRPFQFSRTVIGEAGRSTDLAIKNFRPSGLAE